MRQFGAWVAFLAAGVSACGGGDSGPPKVASVTVTSPAAQLETGGTVALTAVSKDSKGNTLSGRKVTWATSAPSTATVDAAGVVSGVAPGNAVITATAEGASGTVALTVIPIPVAAVVIAPRTPSVRQGETTQLSATTVDGIGRTLSGRTVTWTSRNPATATVAQTGLVSGVAAGTVFIVATSETRSDSVALRVRSLFAPTITSTGSGIANAGTSATVTGTNFSLVPSENEVVINGVTAQVTGSTGTTVTFTVPSANVLPCTATGPVPLAVVVNGDTASSFLNLRVATPRALAVGAHALFTASSDLNCNEFSSTGGRYLVTAFNSATSSAIRTNFRLVGHATSQASQQSVLAAMPSPSTPTAGPLVSRLSTHGLEPYARGHLAALQASEPLASRTPQLRRALETRRTAARRGLATATPSARLAFGASSAQQQDLVVGDKFWARMFRTWANYTTFDSVRVRVVYVGPKIIMVEDTTNELAGQMDDEYQRVGTDFDNNMYSMLSSFGDPLVLDSLTDNNGRAVAVFSKRVNEYDLPSGGSLLGYVLLCDFFPRTDPNPNFACPPSNEGEYFYAITPNPNGLRGKHSLATWRRFVRGTMIHEMKHIVMYAYRILLDANEVEATWLEEATAQMATELWARKIYGTRPQRSDIGWADGPRCDYASASATCPDPTEAILHPFNFLYSHYSQNETKSIINNSDLVIYGSSWSFARWATDAYDGGNEAQFLRALTQQRDDRGLANLQNRTGRTWTEMLGLFSMASTADNYPGGTVNDSRLRLPSWNTRDVFSGMNANLVLSGSNAPAFPLVWPLRVRTPSFGTFPDVIQQVIGLPGGGWAAWEISGSQASPQALAVRSLTGGPPPSGIGMVVLRVQ